MNTQNSDKVDASNKAFDYQAKKPETIIIAGCARLPEGTTAKHVFGCLTIELEVDPVDSVVVDFACTLVPHLSVKILHNALLGNEVEEGIKEAVTQLNKRFFNPTKRAIIAALEDAHRWYKKYLKKKKADQDTE